MAKKIQKKFGGFKKCPYLCSANSKKMVQTYGAMVAQQILVLLVEVRILIGLPIRCRDVACYVSFFYQLHTAKV